MKMIFKKLLTYYSENGFVGGVQILRAYVRLLYKKHFLRQKIQMHGYAVLESRVGLVMKGREARLELYKGVKIRGGANIRVENGLLVLGSGVFINHNTIVTCLKRIVVGKNSKIGPNVAIFDHNHNYKGENPAFILGEIEIGENVWIGANCVILSGAKIGNNVVVGAGSIVNTTINDNILYVSERAARTRELER